jgi:methyl-accepting chemotaxis protein WspA
MLKAKWLILLCWIYRYTAAFMLNSFSHLKLRDRALLGYAVPTGLLITFSGIVYVSSMQLLQTFEQVNNGQNKLLIRSELLTHHLNMDRRIRRFLLDGGTQEAIDLFQQDHQKFVAALEKAKPLIQEPEQIQVVQHKQEAQQKLYDLGNETVRKVRLAGGTNQALQKEYVQASLALTSDYERWHDELDKRQQNTTEQQISSAKAKMLFLEIVAVVFTLLSIVTALLMIYMISNALGNRVFKVVNIAEKISAGDLSQKLSESPKTRDKTSHDEIGQLMSSFQNMSRRLNDLITQVQRASIQVTASCTQLSASGRQLEGTITEQVASTNQVTTTAKQIAATSEELVHTMEELSNMSQNTSHTANGQQQDLLRMGTTMQQLAGATDLISTKLGTISEKANNITTIVGTISKVADQTNLLSLNAAIEAEKAGELGLGFSVVAKEIRRLADQTAIATVDIEQMIKEMQSAVSTGVMEMDKFAREVRQGVTEVAGITAQVGQVIVQVQELSPRFEVVNQGMEMQFQGAQQISEAMIQLSNASTQTADSLQEINRVIEHLNQAEQGLRREIMQFKLNDQVEERELAKLA